MPWDLAKAITYAPGPISKTLSFGGPYEVCFLECDACCPEQLPPPKICTALTLLAFGKAVEDLAFHPDPGARMLMASHLGVYMFDMLI